MCLRVNKEAAAEEAALEEVIEVVSVGGEADSEVEEVLLEEETIEAEEEDLEAVTEAVLEAVEGVDFEVEEASLTK